MLLALSTSERELQTEQVPVCVCVKLLSFSLCDEHPTPVDARQK